MIYIYIYTYQHPILIIFKTATILNLINLESQVLKKHESETFRPSAAQEALAPFDGAEPQPLNPGKAQNSKF